MAYTITDMPCPLLSRALTRFIAKPEHVFEGFLLTKFELLATLDIDTAATDCVSRIWYNPEFFNELTCSEIMGVLAHEVYHYVHLHGIRKRGRANHDGWNIAADFECNAGSKRGGYHLPGTPVSIAETIRGIEDPAFAEVLKARGPIYYYDPLMIKPSYTTAEKIYDMIMNAMDKSGRAAPSLDNIFGGDMDEDAMEQASQEHKDAGVSERAMISEVQGSLQQALRRADRMGQASAGRKLLADVAERLAMDWREHLMQWCTTAVTQDDWSWSRPNWQYLIKDNIIAPSLYSEAAGVGVVMVDTSGSCARALPQFGAQVQALFDQLDLTEIVIIYSDYGEAWADVFEKGETIKWNPKGGGGTSFRAPFKWVAENMSDEPPSFAVYLTDLCGVFPAEAPEDYPVLWVSVDVHEKPAPFGETIYMRL